MECCNCGKDFDISELTDIGGHLACYSCKVTVIARIGETGRAVNSSSPSVVSNSVQYYEYGGVWIRYGARIIDGLVVGAILMIPFFIGAFALGVSGAVEGNSPDDGIAVLFFLAIAFSYFVVQGFYDTWFLVNKGATLGKMACGLQVIDEDGQRLTYGKAFCRFLCQSGQPFVFIPILGSIIGLIVTIGHFVAIFDDEKRALHDRLAGSFVIRN